MQHKCNFVFPIKFFVNYVNCNCKYFMKMTWSCIFFYLLCSFSIFLDTETSSFTQFHGMARYPQLRLLSPWAEYISECVQID